MTTEWAHVSRDAWPCPAIPLAHRKPDQDSAAGLRHDTAHRGQPLNIAPRAQGPDLEIYPADFNPTRQGEAVEFWVPVKG